MDHFDNSKMRLEDDFDWLVFIDLFVTIGAIMILMLSYFSYRKYQLDDNLSLLTNQTNIQKNILSDFEKKNAFEKDNKQSLVKNTDILHNKLQSSDALLEKRKEELVHLQKNRNILKETLKANIENADKNFEKTYETFKILKALDTVKTQEKDNIVPVESDSKNILVDDLLSLAQRIKKAEEYKSVFKEKMVSLVGNQDKIQVVDDRFILSSEFLFSSGSTRLTAQGKKALEPVIDTLKNIVNEAPADLDWIIRIDGHADRLKILRKNLSNRQLSAQRSLEIVKYLEDQGIPPKRLVATAFGSHYPRSKGIRSKDLALDRRIEIKITNR